MFVKPRDYFKHWAAILALGITCLLPLTLVAQGDAPYVRSEIQHVGGAEFRTIAGGGFDPDHQPPIYWHDGEWKLDLITPTPQQGGGTITIQQANGQLKVVVLPEIVAQIDSITRGPNDRAIVIDEITGSGLMAFAIIDLMSAKLIDNVAVYDPVRSPNSRFIIYINGFSPHSPFPTEDHYRLYDLLRTPVDNTCGYRANDPEHKILDELWRGQPVYPLKKNEIFRPSEDPNAPAGSLHEIVGTFFWSPDSSKVLFADSQGSALSLILVLMPNSAHDLPKTMVYRVSDMSEASTGLYEWSDIKSVEWTDDGIRVTLEARSSRGRNMTKVVSVKATEFEPASRQAGS
jgi:hypothetical protein